VQARDDDDDGDGDAREASRAPAREAEDARLDGARTAGRRRAGAMARRRVRR